MTKTGDGCMHGTPYCSHGYVPLKWGVDVVTRIGTRQLRQVCNKVVQLFNLGNGLHCVQSGVCLTKFGHGLLLSLSAQPDNV